LLVKDLSKGLDEGKLLFLSPAWVTPNFCVIYCGFYNVEALERKTYFNEIESLFFNQDMKIKNLIYIVYTNRVSSLLVSLPIDIINKKKRQDKQAKNKAVQNSQSTIEDDKVYRKMIPNYIYLNNNMNVFNFIAYKSVRLANNFCKKWIWYKENKKVIADFINVIARHRICEGFELVHTCNDDLLFIKVAKIQKNFTENEYESGHSLIQYLIKQNK
jgi:hypothetical protein